RSTDQLGNLSSQLYQRGMQGIQKSVIRNKREGTKVEFLFALASSPRNTQFMKYEIYDIGNDDVGIVCVNWSLHGETTAEQGELRNVPRLKSAVEELRSRRGRYAFRSGNLFEAVVFRNAFYEAFPGDTWRC